MDQTVRNIKELAALLNISPTTVSRVLNGKADDYRISPATTKKVLDAAREFNYHPNRIARGLRLEKTETIGLIVPDIANPFFAHVAKTIEFEARRNGYSIILCDSLDDIETESELLKLLAGRKVDGIILAPVGTGTGHISEFLKREIPSVVIDRYLPGLDIPSVSTDNYTGAYLATEHFIAAGHSRIACIQGINGISVNTDRVDGYRDALKNHNLTVDNSMIAGDDFGEKNGYDQTVRLLGSECRPTAILALSNLISLGVMRALSEAGLKIPDDMSLVSFDDQPYSAFLASPMTTVEQMKEEIAREAVQILLENINSGRSAGKVNKKIMPELIIRNSVKNMRKIPVRDHSSHL